MITTERISVWLEQPHQLQEVAPKALAQFEKEYPYFTPAQYFRFIGARQGVDSIQLLQQYSPVNAVLLARFLQDAAHPPLEKASPVIEVPPAAATVTVPSREDDAVEEVLIQPVSAEDYFLQQGIHVSGDMPEKEAMLRHDPEHLNEDEKEKALMVVMTFAEWLKHISSKNQKEKEEEAEQKALKAMWQQQKLAAAIEEESDEIPEQVFEMAVNSISRKDELISESLAEVYVKQGKKEKAIDMYQKLSLLNPEKNTYFAAKIENLQKDL